MTLVNAILAADRQTATVVTDTAYTRGDPLDPRSAGEVSKMLAVPHLFGLVAGRGSLGMITTAMGAILDMADFDHAKAHLDDGLGKAFAHLRQSLPDMPDFQEVALCAWSRSAGGFRFGRWLQPTAAEGFAYHELGAGEVLLAPGGGAILEELGDAPQDAAGLVAATKVQIAAARREFGAGFAIGGALLVAELSHGRITIERRPGEAQKRQSWFPAFPVVAVA